MGCVFGKQGSAKPVEKEDRKEGGGGGGEVRVVKKAEVSDVAQNGGNRNENEERTVSVRTKGERRRSSKLNPRLSNPPKHIHGEQVAAGWPSWLSAVAGEAINGWTPRRADTFEKLDKVSLVEFFADAKCMWVLVIFDIFLRFIGFLFGCCENAGGKRRNF